MRLFLSRWVPARRFLNQAVIALKTWTLSERIRCGQGKDALQMIKTHVVRGTLANLLQIVVNAYLK